MKTITEISKAISNKHISIKEVAYLYLKRIKEDKTNSFISYDENHLDLEIKNAESVYRHSPNPLMGVPIAHKDLFCVEGLKATCGSKMLSNFIAPYDATIVKLLKNKGMPTLGKLAMDEFAMGSFTNTSYFGKTLHPLDLERTVGGSSGGSASAVLAGLTPIATGSDTGGSIRTPAAFCGLYGFKPTYGAISRHGMIAYASSLDTAGFIGLSPEDIHLVFSEVSKKDPLDSTSISINPDVSGIHGANLKNKKVGYIKEFVNAGMSKDLSVAFHNHLNDLKKIGMDVQEVSIKNIALAVSAYYILASAEASSNLSRYDGIKFGYAAKNEALLEEFYLKSRTEGFGSEVKRRILLGTYVLSEEYFDAYYIKAAKVRREILNSVIAVLKSVDYLIAPCFPTVAPRFDDINKMSPEEIYASDLFTIPFSLAGLPTFAYPIGVDENKMPIGVQMIGMHKEDYNLLSTVEKIKKEGVIC